MQRIVPNIWLNDTADELIQFYQATFPNFEVLRTDYYSDAGKEIHGHNAGDVLTVSFAIGGYEFMALNGGQAFTPNPSISFFYYAETTDELDAVARQLMDGGNILMELGVYPFSEYYGWVSDRFGVSWQLTLATSPITQRVMPSLLFHGANTGKAQEAIDFYVSVFDNASKGTVSPYPEGMEPDVPGTLAYGDFTLYGEMLAAMDSAREHNFEFSEGISLVVTVDDQAAVDRYWSALSAVPEAEACGWLKDKYGVSWQIVPVAMEEMMANGTPEQLERVMAAYMPMKKFDIAALQAAYDGQ